MKKLLSILTILLVPVISFASESDLIIPDLKTGNYFGLNGWTLLCWGFIIIGIGMFFGYWQYKKVKAMPAHKSMLDVSDTIYETCKTYLLQQGKFLIILFILVGVVISYYFLGLKHWHVSKVLLVLLWTILGVLGYIV